MKLVWTINIFQNSEKAKPVNKIIKIIKNQNLKLKPTLVITITIMAVSSKNKSRRNVLNILLNQGKSKNIVSTKMEISSGE